MPNRNTLIFLTLAAFAGAAALYTNKEGRGSQTNPKWSQLKPRDELFVRTHKLSPPIAATLNSDLAAPIEAGTTFQLTARISVTQDAQSLNASWLLPDGVTWISGDFQKSFSLNPKHDAVVAARFRNDSNENTVVRLIIEQNGTAVWSQDFHTLRQTEINEELRELAARQIELSETKSEWLLQPEESVIEDEH